MVKKRTPTQIKEDYDTLEALSKKYFSEERYEKVMKLFKHFQDRMIKTPASNREDYHACYPGGWLQHTRNVITNAMHLIPNWKRVDAIDGFTVEEVVFSAMFHDLAKLGDLDEPYYIPEASEWHRKRGMLYKFNPDLIQFSKIPLRSIWILNQFGIKLSENEMYGIYCSDGLFDDNLNKQYFLHAKTNLPMIIHHADIMSALSEKVKVVKAEKVEVESFKDLFTTKKGE